MTTCLVTIASSLPPDEVASRLILAIEARGMTIFGRIDHAAAARAAGLTLRPTEVFVFGNPKAGTLLMQIAPTAGLDLPLKILVWQDDAGATHLTYEDPAAMAARHDTAPQAAPVVAGMSAILDAISREAAG